MKLISVSFYQVRHIEYCHYLIKVKLKLQFTKHVRFALT